MTARTQKGPRANGGRRWDVTAGNRRTKYNTVRVFASTTKRAGTLLDEWVTSTYRAAETWQRIFELSGEAPEPQVAEVLDYVRHRFLYDTAGQMALFLAWREHALGEPRRDPPADIAAHNLKELRRDAAAFHRVLVGMGRLAEEERAS